MVVKKGAKKSRGTKSRGTKSRKNKTRKNIKSKKSMGRYKNVNIRHLGRGLIEELKKIGISDEDAREMAKNTKYEQTPEKSNKNKTPDKIKKLMDIGIPEIDAREMAKNTKYELTPEKSKKNKTPEKSKKNKTPKKSKKPAGPVVVGKSSCGNTEKEILGKCYIDHSKLTRNGFPEYDLQSNTKWKCLLCGNDYDNNTDFCPICNKEGVLSINIFRYSTREEERKEK